MNVNDNHYFFQEGIVNVKRCTNVGLNQGTQPSLTYEPFLVRFAQNIIWWAFHKKYAEIFCGNKSEDLFCSLLFRTLAFAKFCLLLRKKQKRSSYQNSCRNTPKCFTHQSEDLFVGFHLI